LPVTDALPASAPNKDLLVVRMDGQDGAKVHLFPHLGHDPLDADGVAGRDADTVFPRFE